MNISYFKAIFRLAPALSIQIDPSHFSEIRFHISIHLLTDE